jgi:sulfoxide reductase heme-binding subunit YedZ
MLIKADIREPVIYIIILTGLLGVRLLHHLRQKKLSAQ